MRHTLFSIFFLLALMLLPGAVHAATITFDPQETDVGTDTAFLVGVDLDATQPVNVVSLALHFSPGLAPVNVSDGNSILSFWVDKPTFDEQSHTLTFSGLVPAGYSGTKARLVLLSVKASQTGVGTISVDGASHVYLNGAAAQEDTLVSAPLVLNVTPMKHNLSNILSDTTAPESFTPVVAWMPSGTGREAWALLFATEDKGSGIDHFEVRETDAHLPWWGSGWHTAVSPYVLEDQSRQSRIEVRVTDKDGNMRETALGAAENSTRMRILSIALGIVGILGIVLGVRLLKRRL